MDPLILAIALGALAGLAGGGVLAWWVLKTFWDSYQTTRIARRIRKERHHS